MPKHCCVILILSLAITSSGCGRAPSSEVAPREVTAAAREVSRDAAPGSHEDWCDEHQVPESLCTRCNGSLIPAFKATGDWCETHQLPRSQDLADNPGLKVVRPPKPDGGA
ncbi:MAG: hypothetical protein U0166_11900 [Acidobacteriota bacterium]